MMISGENYGLAESLVVRRWIETNKGDWREISYVTQTEERLSQIMEDIGQTREISRMLKVFADNGSPANRQLDRYEGVDKSW